GRAWQRGMIPWKLGTIRPGGTFEQVVRNRHLRQRWKTGTAQPSSCRPLLRVRLSRSSAGGVRGGGERSFPSPCPQSASGDQFVSLEPSGNELARAETNRNARPARWPKPPSPQRMATFVHFPPAAGTGTPGEGAANGRHFPRTR